MRALLRVLLLAAAAALVVATLLPLSRSEAWWVRILDFPRAQLAVLGLLVAGGLALAALAARRRGRPARPELVALVLVGACVAYQAARIAPYTPLAPRTVTVAAQPAAERSLSLLVANVLQTNERKRDFLELVAAYDPDVLLVLEADEAWAEALRPLEERWPEVVAEPLDNTYGMVLYSRLPLDAEVRYLVEPGIPSIHGDVRLPSGERVRLHLVHPRPPGWQHAQDTGERDAEVLLVAREVEDRPTVVAGDFNDVAWSDTTTLFQEVSGLLDPRRGRGLYSTFDATNPLLRWPLDHVFHSDHFELVRLERGPAFGSDHFPVFAELALTPLAELRQDEPEPEPEDLERAEEKIEAEVAEREEP